MRSSGVVPIHPLRKFLIKERFVDDAQVDVVIDELLLNDTIESFDITVNFRRMWS